MKRKRLSYKKFNTLRVTIIHKYCICIKTAILFWSFSGVSQEQLKDSVWVSVYTNKSESVNNTSPYTSLFYNNVYIASCDTIPEGFELVPLASSLDDLLKQTQLNNSYSSTEIAGTELEKSLRTVERFSFPYASVVTSALAEKLNLITNTPKLVGYNNSIHLLVDTTNKTLTTKQLLKYLHDNSTHKLDERKYLRKRLLDFLVGNTNVDIEEDKWIVEQTPQGKKIQPYISSYHNQFMRYDGTYKLITKLIEAYKHLEPYSASIKNVKKTSKKFIGFDVNILSSSTYDLWQEEVDYIKENLNSSVLETIRKELPKGVQSQAVEELFEYLTNRIKNIHHIAEVYYNLVSTNKIITATNKNDLIEIKRKTDSIVIKIYDEKKGKSVANKIYNFPVKNTKEIWVYGLNGSDYFEVKGEAKKYIPIKLIGGKNGDKYEITNGKKVQIFDNKSQTFTVLKHRAKLKLSDDTNITDYQPQKYKHIQNKIKPKLGANPDDGIFLGLVNEYTVKGVEQNPHTLLHQLAANFYLGNFGFKFGYYGEKANVYKNFNAYLNLGYQSPNYSTNFFGFGNETPNFDDNLKLDYNRVRMENIDVNLGIFKKHKHYFASGHLFFESRKIDETPDRFVASETLFFPKEDFFDRKNYVGVTAIYEYTNVEIPFLSSIEIKPKLEVKATANLNEFSTTNIALSPSLFLAHPLYTDKIFIDATIGYKHVFGEDVPFYQAASIGGSSGLRGYRNQRFTGQSSLIATTNFKWLIKELESEILPLQLGVLGGVDAGRVWVKNENSSKMHSDYGVGLWLQTSQMIKAELQAFNGNEGMRFSVHVAIGF